DIIGKEEMFTLNYENSLALFDAIIESIKNLLNQNEIHHHYLKRITMGVPGSVNQKTRKMLMTQSWFNVEEVENIEKLVEASFPC
ncbi:hypothetical protein, partial [Anoxynatronum sibiricum]